MNVRRTGSRFLALFGLLAALAALGLFTVPAGCGGGGGGKTTKKGSGKKKSGESGETKKDDTGEGEASPELIEKETIKDKFLGTYQDVYKGEASPAQLYKALEEAVEKLEKFDKDDWYDKFKHQLMGLDQGRVESAAWFLEQQKDKAFANLEDVPAAKAALQEVRDFLEPVDRSRLDPAVKVGEMQVNYQEEYDNVLAAVDEAEKEFSDMAAIVRRAPPASPTNLIEGDEDLWEEEGSIEVTIAMGSMVLESPKGGGRVTAVHYYLKDFTLRCTFTMQSGGFDLMARALPGKGSPFFGGFSRDDFNQMGLDPDAPFTMVIEVKGDTARFMDDQGRLLTDPIVTDRAPAGGGIGIKLRSAGSQITFQEFVVEAQ